MTVSTVSFHRDIQIFLTTAAIESTFPGLTKDTDSVPLCGTSQVRFQFKALSLSEPIHPPPKGRRQAMCEYS